MDTIRPDSRFGSVALACGLFAGAAVLAGVPCTDTDGDGFFRESSCGTAVDCNDADPLTHPFATETCDGYDRDCDGVIDNAAACDPICGAPGKLGVDQQLADDDSGSVSLPTVVWNGTDYAMIWRRNNFEGSRLFFQRFDTAGAAVGPRRELIFQADGFDRFSLVWTGSEYGLTARVGPYPYEVWFLRLHADGVPIGAPLVLADDTNESGRPDLVWTGSEYGVVWYEGPGKSDWDLFFARISAAGEKIGADIQLTDSGYQIMSSLVWNGSGYGLAWIRNHLAPDAALMFARLDALGNKIGSDVSIAPVERWGLNDGLVWTGSEYAVAYFSGGFPDPEVFIARLDATGNEIGQAQSLAVDTGSEVSEVLSVDLAFTGSEFGLHWAVIRYGTTSSPCFPTNEGTIWFHRVDLTGALQGPALRLSQEPGGIVFPRVVWNGNEYGAFWSDARTTCLNNVYYRRIGCFCSVDDDQDGFSGLCDDCDDFDPTIYPGAAQVCDGANNDCDAANWPDLGGTNDGDNDGDTFSECAGDCRPFLGATFPGAPEINDGRDNQCAGDPGFGTVDETSGESGFVNPANNDEYSWPAQSGATLYAVARSLDPLFGVCTGFDTSTTTWNDPKIPPAGAVYYYLNRPVAPNLGSWGLTTAGVHRNASCSPP